MHGGAQAVAKNHPALHGAGAQLRPAPPVALQGLNEPLVTKQKESAGPWDWRKPLMRPKYPGSYLFSSTLDGQQAGGCMKVSR